MMQGKEFSIDLRILELGGCDVVRDGNLTHTRWGPGFLTLSGMDMGHQNRVWEQGGFLPDFFNQG